MAFVTCAGGLERSVIGGRFLGAVGNALWRRGAAASGDEGFVRRVGDSRLVSDAFGPVVCLGSLAFARCSLANSIIASIRGKDPTSLGNLVGIGGVCSSEGHSGLVTTGWCRPEQTS